MGLTIHYTLSLPDTFTPEQAVQRVSALHRLAADLPVAVSPCMHIANATISRVLARKARPELYWVLMRSERVLPIQRMPDGSARYAVDGSSSVGVIPHELIGFSVGLGSGCETLQLYLAEFPTTTRAATKPPSGGGVGLSDIIYVPPPRRWCGQGFCKTQYACSAAVGGLTNFLRCHLSIIALLDAAADLGFAVEVMDESGYHEHRNLRTLVTFIGSWDGVLAELGDRLQQRFGGTMVPHSAFVRAQPRIVAVSEAIADQIIDLIDRTRGSLIDVEASTSAK